MASDPSPPSLPPDCYGQIHPIETPELIERALAQFRSHLNHRCDILGEEHPNLLRAKESGLHTDDFILQFLRCEVFNLELAVARYVCYWDRRVEVFGPVLAFQPLTLHQALQHDTVALEQEFIRVVEGNVDNGKRTYLFLDPSKQKIGSYESESMVRVMWYFIHAVMNDDLISQRKGIVFVSFPKYAFYQQFDQYFVRHCIASIKGCLPVRFSAFHICHPDRLFRVCWPMVKALMGKRMRQRVLVHAGSFQDVLIKLESKYEFDRSDLPVDVGGERELDGLKWLEERKKQGK